jgi:putative transposase
MPILRRRLLPGYPIHVLQRGHNRARSFHSDDDHVLYLGLLQEFSKRHGCAIHAYVLMTNHIHLLVSPPTIPALSGMMKDLNQIYVQHVNRHQRRCGSLWQGRFKSCLVDSERYFLTCQRYIELNPVRAGLVDYPSAYPWSSYPINADGQPSGLITPHAMYLGLASDAEDRIGAYRMLFGQSIAPELLARIRTSVNRGRPLGDEAFVRAIDSQTEVRPGSDRGLTEV